MEKRTQTEDYVRWVRPLTGKLLRGMGMDVSYSRGEGDWLWTDEENPRRVLDLTGGYGANLLGHSHPRLVSKAHDILSNQTPNLLQGSVRPEAAKLAKKIEELLSKETGSSRWITHFSNSGTESVEAAIKFCQLNFSKFLEETRQRIILNKNTLLHQLRSGQIDEELLHKRLVFLTDETGETEELLHRHFQNTLNKLNVTPLMASFANAFHGKTSGSLGLTANSKFKAGFSPSVQTVTVRAELSAVREAFEMHSVSLILLDEKDLRFREVEFFQLAGFFLEPIQGEGGIYELDSELVRLVRSLSGRGPTLLVSDEVQSGLFRTGKMAALSHSDVLADVYCFSKALGGGLAKIGATVIQGRTYREEFGLLHTSTFAEDAFSSSIASEVLEICDDAALIEKAMGTAGRFRRELEQLASVYPDIIREVRGRGMMMGIEFCPEIADFSYEEKIFSDQSMMGYLLSAILLQRENLRLSPSLSNEMTLRIEPSLFLTSEMVDYALAGIRNLCRALDEHDSNYLFGPLFLQGLEKGTGEIQLRKAFEINKEKVHGRKSQRPLAVFLCHLIDPDHTKLFLNSVKEVPADVLEKKIYDFSLIQEFSVYYRDTLTGENGEEIDVAMMSIPLTSQEIVNFTKKNKRTEIITKIQKAIQHAKELGATTVGLGQFTSIVTKNGLTLDSLGMNLTTGNAFTVKLGVDAALNEVKAKGLSPENLHVCSVGSAGNITSVVNTMISEYCRKMTLIHRQNIYQSPKFQEVIIQMLKDIRASHSDSPCVRGIQRLLEKEMYRPDRDLYEILNDERFCEFIEINDNDASMKEADLIICGTNSPKTLIGKEDISPNTIIVDISVPRNVHKNVEEVPGVSLILGGVAKLPQLEEKSQTIDTPIFPMQQGECFACMGETFTLGLSGAKGKQNIGGISKKSVEEVGGLAESVGIRLGSAKKVNSL